jgi:hypothetical protein
MKTKDLVVGTDYAVNESTYGKPYRATVLEVNATYDKQVGFLSSRTERVSGMVKVEAVSGDYVTKGDVLYVKPQHVRQTWAAEHAERVALGKQRAAQQRREAAERKQRAEQAFALHKALEAKGAKVGLGYSYVDENYAALVAAGFEPVKQEYFAGRGYLHSALNGLSTLMEDGTVPLDQMAFLLDLSTEAPRPEDDLADYDLDEEG